MKLKKKVEELQEVPLDDDVKDVPFIHLPDDLSPLPLLPTLSSYELGTYHSMCAAYMGFLNETIAVLRTEATYAKVSWRRKRAEALVNATGQFKAKQFAKVRCRVDIKEAEKAYVTKRAEVGAWNSCYWTLKCYMDAVRLEIDRRRWDLQDSKED